MPQISGSGADPAVFSILTFVVPVTVVGSNVIMGLGDARRSSFWGAAPGGVTCLFSPVHSSFWSHGCGVGLCRRIGADCMADARALRDFVPITPVEVFRRVSTSGGSWKTAGSPSSSEGSDGGARGSRTICALQRILAKNMDLDLSSGCQRHVHRRIVAKPGILWTAGTECRRRLDRFWMSGCHLSTMGRFE